MLKKWLGAKRRPHTKTYKVDFIFKMEIRAIRHKGKIQVSKTFKTYKNGGFWQQMGGEYWKTLSSYDRMVNKTP